jgi:cyclic pyranopterin phosphate synthase
MAKDVLGRRLKDLRISVTDRCNFRCTYCMPLTEYEWIDRHELLSYEEILRLARLFVRLGTEKVRVTGGEPLVRKQLEVLLKGLAGLPRIKDLSLTTNGALLAEQAPALRAAGLQRINVSLDTLDPEKFKRISQRGKLSDVLDGLRTAQRCGFHPIKINAVIERGVNDDEIVRLAEFARQNGYTLRYIEYMDAGNANQWRLDKVVSKKQILATLSTSFPLREARRAETSAPAVDYEYADGSGEVGVIASVTEPFCRDCDRARLTADGKLVTCLFSPTGRDLKSRMRSGATDDELAEIMAGTWLKRSDRYSEERFAALSSASGYEPRSHPKMEMIVLGG